MRDKGEVAGRVHLKRVFNPFFLNNYLSKIAILLKRHFFVETLSKSTL